MTGPSPYKTVSGPGGAAGFDGSEDQPTDDATTEPMSETASDRDAQPDEQLREQMRDDVARVGDRPEVDGTPTVQEYETWGTFGVGRVIGVFGSWAAACEAAGFEPNTRGRTIPDDELLRAVSDLTDYPHVDGEPRPVDMKRYGRYSLSPYRERWDDWADVVAAAARVDRADRADAERGPR